MTNPRETVFQERFREDLRYWVASDRKAAEHIFRLIEEVTRDPFHGIGKPEHLKCGSDLWSRELNQVDRMVYLVRSSRIDFLQARYHYSDVIEGTHFDQRFCPLENGCRLRSAKCPRLHG
jgi:toxin YoeB